MAADDADSLRDESVWLVSRWPHCVLLFLVQRLRSCQGFIRREVFQALQGIPAPLTSTSCWQTEVLDNKEQCKEFFPVSRISLNNEFIQLYFAAEILNHSQTVCLCFCVVTPVLLQILCLLDSAKFQWLSSSSSKMLLLFCWLITNIHWTLSHWPAGRACALCTTHCVLWCTSYIIMCAVTFLFN